MLVGILERSSLKNVTSVLGSTVPKNIEKKHRGTRIYASAAVSNSDRDRRTVDFLRDLHTHLDQPQLIQPRLEIPNELHKHIYAVRFRKRVVEEFDELQRKLMPQSI